MSSYVGMRRPRAVAAKKKSTATISGAASTGAYPAIPASLPGSAASSMREDPTSHMREKSPRREVQEVAAPQPTTPKRRDVAAPALASTSTSSPQIRSTSVRSGATLANASPARDAVSPNPSLSAGGAAGKIVQEAVHVCLKFAPRRNSADPNDDGLQMDFDGGDLTLHDKTITHDGKEDYERRRYKYAHVFGPKTVEDEVHAHLWAEAEPKLAAGYNATILCYGQTGSGKTYTIEHLLPRMLGSCFSHTEQLRKREGVAGVRVQASYLQIYMDTVYNLLSPNTKDAKKNLGISLDWKNKTWDALPKGYVDIDSADQALGLIKNGNKYRATNAHALNERSSRSHSLFFLNISKTTGNLQQTSTLLLVDLAGSERFQKTRATGDVFEEGKAINKALTTLGRVMEGLARGDRSIPYRENILTMYLRETLTNSFFALICCCSSDARDSDETRCTLKFGSVAKNVTITRRANDLLKQRLQLKKEKEQFAKTLADITLSHQAELSDLERQVEETHAEGVRWKTEAAQMREKLAREMKQKEEIEERLAALTAELSHRESEAEVGMQDLSMIQEKYDELLLEIKAEQQARQVFEDAVQVSNEKVSQLQEELSAKSREVESIACDKGALEAELNRRRQELVEVREMLEAEVEEGQSALREREAELSGEIEKLDGDLHATRRNLERMQAQHSELLEDLRKREREGEEARRQLHEMEDELGAARQELNAKSREVDDIRSEVAKRRRELVDVREQLEAEVEEGQSALREREAELTGEIEKLDDDLHATRNELERMQREHKTVLTNLRAREEEGNAAKRQLQQVEEELSAARRQLDSKTREVEDIKSERVAMEREVAKRRRELVDVREQLEAEVEEGQSALREREAELTGEIEKLDSDLNSTRLHLEKMQREHEVLRKNLRRKEQDEHHAKLRLGELEEELDAAKRKASALQSESTTLRKGRHEAQQLATKYLEENTKITSIVRAKETEVESLTQQADALRDQIHEIVGKRDADVKATKKLQRQLEMAEDQHVAAANDITFLEENIRTVETRLRSTEDDLADKNEKISSLEQSIAKERAAYQANIESLQETIDQLEEDQNTLREELDRVNRHRADVEAAYEKLRLEVATKDTELKKTKQHSFRVQEHSADLEVQLATEAERMDRLDKRLKATEMDHHTTLRHIKEELDTVQRERDELRENYADNTELIEHLNDQLDDTQRRYSEQVEQTAAAQVAQRELQNQIAAYTSQLDTEKTVALKLRSDYEAIQAKLRSASVTPEEVPLLKEELKKTKVMLDTSEMSVQQLQDELRSLIDKHEDAITLSESQSRKCAQLSQECMQGLRELQTAREEIEQQRRNNEELRHNAAKSKLENKKMQRDIHVMKKRHASDKIAEAELKKLPVYQARQALLQKQLNRLDVTNKSLQAKTKEEERSNKHLVQQIRAKDRDLATIKRKHANEMRRKKAESDRAELRIQNLEKKVWDMKKHMDNQEMYITSVARKMKATEHEKEVLKHVLDQNQTFAYLQKGAGTRSCSAEEGAELNRALARGGGSFVSGSVMDFVSPARSHSNASGGGASRQGSLLERTASGTMLQVTRQASRSASDDYVSYADPSAVSVVSGMSGLSKEGSSRRKVVRGKRKAATLSPGREYARAASYDPERERRGSGFGSAMVASSSYAPHVPKKTPMSGSRRHGGYTSRSNNSFSSPPPPPRSAAGLSDDESYLMSGGMSQREFARPAPSMISSATGRSDQGSAKYGPPVQVAIRRENSGRTGFNTAASQSSAAHQQSRSPSLSPLPRFQPPPESAGSLSQIGSFSSGAHPIPRANR